MERGDNIGIIICSLMFGIMVGFVKDSFWWGVGVTIGCYIALFFGHWLGVMLDGIDNELEERRNKRKL